MPSFSDPTGHTLSLPHPPRRIVSLVPSQTELLHDLGLEEEVVGITKFCIHPDAWFRNKTRIGGTKQLHLDRIEALKPDLVIANKEENLKEEVEKLQKKFPVWTSDVNDLPGALEMILTVGVLTNREERASTISKKIQTTFQELAVPMRRPRAAYLIWRQPYMAAGGDTFINDMLRIAGFDNVFSSRMRYPEIDIDDLRAVGCECVLLSSEPYPFREKHIAELQAALPGVQVVLVDGELFSWYGSRLLHTPAYFKDLRKQVGIT